MHRGTIAGKVMLTLTVGLGAVGLTAAEARADEPFLGGLGKAYAGGLALDVGNVESSLRPLMGSDVAIGDIGLQMGGGGFGMIGGVVLAGGGYAVFLPTENSDDGTVSLIGGGGGFALGYAVVNDRDWIVYPSVGVGGFGYTLGLTNVTGLPLELGDDVTIEAGRSQDLQAGFLTMDFGVSANRMLFFGNDGGFAVGFDAGFLTSVMGGQWEAEDGGVATVLERARLRGFYMRLTLGGGGFWFDE